MSDYTTRNIEHFNKRAASYDISPLKVALAKKCSDAFLEIEGVKWESNSTVVVDFACGTGLLQFFRTHAYDRLDLSEFSPTCTHYRWT